MAEVIVRCIDRWVLRAIRFAENKQVAFAYRDRTLTLIKRRCVLRMIYHRELFFSRTTVLASDSKVIEYRLYSLRRVAVNPWRMLE